jgi:hypothetical protein
MSETKFTQGSWIPAGPSFGEHKMRFASSVVLDRDDDEYPDDICAMPLPYYDEEQEANANLIAAAPDLYRALELALPHMHKLTYPEAKADYSDMRYALQKARGEA